MSESVVERVLFPLDTNIDGTYQDSNGTVKTINNMIQVVSATDGSQWYPDNDAINFSEAEVVLVDDLTTEVSDRGLGILYDEDGKRYAIKGDLVFRDDNGNTATLSSIINEVTSISERQDLLLKFKDESLNQLITTKDGININQIIKNTQIKNLPFGFGNISQITRNSDVRKSRVSVFTIPITSEGYVWVIGKADVTGPTTIKLVDVSSGQTLDTSYADLNRYNGQVPCFLSYVGQLPAVDEDLSAVESQCGTAIYNSFFKRFFLSSPDQLNLNVHQLAIEIEPVNEDDVLEYATIDMVVFDRGIIENISHGVEVARSVDNISITLPTEVEDAEYSISIQTEEFVKTWYENKSDGGFTIRFERPYSGFVYWSIVYSEV